MSSPRDAFAAALAVEMRAPLARVELAASQLAREAVRPAARELADGICDAVLDLDRLVTRVLSLLLPSTGTPAQGSDLEGALGGLRERLSPVLEARGVCWEASSAPEPRVQGDPEALRSTSVTLLRVGASLAGSGGRLALELAAEREPGRYGLRLQARRPGEAVGEEELEASLRELRAEVLARGGSLAIESAGGTAVATAWLPCREAPCSGS